MEDLHELKFVGSLTREPLCSDSDPWCVLQVCVFWFGGVGDKNCVTVKAVIVELWVLFGEQ